MARVCCNFEIALIHLREGEKIARESWQDSYIILQNKTIIMVLLPENFKLTVNSLSIDDILAEDWYIL